MKKQKNFVIDRSLWQTSWSAKQISGHQGRELISGKVYQIENEHPNFGIFTTMIRKLNMGKEKILYEKSLAWAISRLSSNKALRQPKENNTYHKPFS